MCRAVVQRLAQDEVAVVKDRLHVTFGTKIEHNDYTGFESSDRTLVWKMSTQQSLWGAVPRGADAFAN